MAPPQEILSVTGANGETLELVHEVVSQASKPLGVLLAELEAALTATVKAQTKACIESCGHMQVGGALGRLLCAWC